MPGKSSNGFLNTPGRRQKPAKVAGALCDKIREMDNDLRFANYG